MTSSRQKLRAALLAVIMVTSIMAVGGLGSAEISNEDVTLSDSAPTPGSNVTVTVTATPDNGNAGFSFTHEFNQSVGDASIVSTSLSDSTIDEANENGVTVSAGSDTFTAGEEVTIEYTITTANADGKTVRITGSVSNNQTQDLPDRSYTVTAADDGGGGGGGGGDDVDEGDTITDASPSIARGDGGNFDPSEDDGAVGDGAGVIGDGAILFQGEDNIVNFDSASVSSASQVSRTGGANEGTPLDNPIPQDAPTGTYAEGGPNADSSAFSVTVQTPRVTTFDVNNGQGEDVNGGTLVASDLNNDNANVSIEYNYAQAEDVELTIEDESGTEVTQEFLDQRGAASAERNIDASEQVNSLEDRFPGDEAKIPINPSQVDEGEYTFSVEGLDDLVFGEATQSTTVTVNTDRNAQLSLESESVTQGENVQLTIDNSPEGNFHVVAIESSDFRDNLDDPEAAEEVFRNVGDTVDTGIVDEGGPVSVSSGDSLVDIIDASEETVYAYAVVEIDDGNGIASVETADLDDTSITVDVFEANQNIANINNNADVVHESGTNVFADDIESNDDQDFDVTEGEIEINSPESTYVTGSEIDVNGTTAAGVDEVAVYVRDQGDYELLEVDGAVTVNVDIDNTFQEEDVRLSASDEFDLGGNDIVSLPGTYRFGVIAESSATTVDPDERSRAEVNGLPEEITSSGFNGGVSETQSLRVLDTALEGSFTFYNGQIAVEDSANGVDVEGVAPGQQNVGIIFVGSRGNTVVETISVDNDDTFDEEGLDVSDLSEGTVSAHVLSVGRDDTAGSTGLDLDEFLTGSVDNEFGGDLTAEQVRENIVADTIDDTGSDDFLTTQRFRLADGLTSIEDVDSTVENNGTIELSGQTNRIPDDTTIVVELLTQEDTVVESTSTDTWGTDGTYNVNLTLDAVETGNYTIEVDDGDSTDRASVQVVEQVTEETPTPTPTPTEESTPTATPEPDTATPTEEPTPTATPTEETSTESGTGTPGFGIVVALVSLIAAALLAVRRNN